MKHNCLNVDISNKDETLKILKSLNIAKIYNLSGPSSVYESINQPKKTFEEITSIFENLISFVKESNSNIFSSFFFRDVW